MKFRMKNGVTINLVRETVRTVEIESQGKPVFKDDALVKRQRRRLGGFEGGFSGTRPQRRIEVT